MPLPAQFNLGLELTNIVLPLSKIVTSLGSLALVDAIKRSGSDLVTELKLASLLGRHRIDPAIKIHFRQVVAKSDRSFISRYVDIILESGAGPTVQEALQDPSLFSMIIQLSALAFAHEDEPLANAMATAIENILRDSGASLESAPDYISLLGTIRACQQQTIAFQWSSLYDAIERKIHSALNPPVENILSTNRGPKRRKVQKSRNSKPKCLGIRCLPFSVLQSLLMWLQTVQSFGEHRILHIKCDTGITNIIMWCHYILGLDITVRLEGTDIQFGEGIANVFVEESKGYRANAALLDAADRLEPLFFLSTTTSDPEIGFEIRVNAFGYGRRILEQVLESDEDIKKYSHWITAGCVITSRSAEDTKNEKGESFSTPSHALVEQRILCAGAFLFALDEVDKQLMEEVINNGLHVETQTLKKIVWKRLGAVIFAFARIRDLQLQQCSTLPLSLDAYSQLEGDEPTAQKHDYLKLRSCGDLMGSFKVLSHLLLGYRYSEDYISPAALISAWGWSIFFNSVDVPDPADLSTETLAVMPGVPTRRGVRKMRIIDGPRSLLTPGKILKIDNQIQFLPGISRTKMGPVLVGQSLDAFSVVQSFVQQIDDRDKIITIGLREMQEVRLKFKLIPSCQCRTTTTEDGIWIDNEIFHRDSSNLFSAMEPDITHEHPLSGRWPLWRKYIHSLKLWEKSLASTHERVFVKAHVHRLPESEDVDRAHRASHQANNPPTPFTWFFQVTRNPAARWLQLIDIYSMSLDRGSYNILRGKDCCIECAVKSVPVHAVTLSQLEFVLL